MGRGVEGVRGGVCGVARKGGGMSWFWRAVSDVVGEVGKGGWYEV